MIKRIEREGSRACGQTLTKQPTCKLTLQLWTHHITKQSKKSAPCLGPRLVQSVPSEHIRENVGSEEGRKLHTKKVLLLVQIVVFWVVETEVSKQLSASILM
jgi:hypothetical protein